MPTVNYSIQLKKAASVVYAGGVIAYPTEGVYGLGCDPFNPDAVGRVLSVKKRPIHKGLILLSDSLEKFTPYLATLTPAQIALITEPSTEPTTWIVPHNNNLPDWITGGRTTVAIRITRHPIALQLCSLLDMPIVSTSANRSQKPSLETRISVQNHLADKIDLIVSGRVQNPGKASRIKDLISGTQLR